MVANGERSTPVKDPLTGEMLPREEAWRRAGNCGIEWGSAFSDAGYHKEITNRLIEPFSSITVILTATDWGNFFEQRCHPHAQAEIRFLATKIRNELDSTVPRSLEWGEWHIPFITRQDADDIREAILAGQLGGGQLLNQVKVATGRSARVSYLTHDGVRSILEDIRLHGDLDGADPPHLSPFEHCTQAKRGRWANLDGFQSYRWKRERGMSISEEFSSREKISFALSKPLRMLNDWVR